MAHYIPLMATLVSKKIGLESNRKNPCGKRVHRETKPKYCRLERAPRIDTFIAGNMRSDGCNPFASDVLLSPLGLPEQHDITTATFRTLSAEGFG